TTVHGPRLKSNQSELWQWILEFRNSDCGFRISAYQLAVLRVTIQNNCNYRVFNCETRSSRFESLPDPIPRPDVTSEIRTSNSEIPAISWRTGSACGHPSARTS